MSTRPTYETVLTIADEEAVASGLAKVFGLRAERNRRYYPIDRSLIDDRNERKIVALLEIKCRTAWYPSMWMAAAKVSWAVTYTMMGLPVLFAWAVREDDRWVVRGLEFKLEQYVPFVWGGRDDRGDPDDMEPCWSVPQTAFTFEHRVNV